MASMLIRDRADQRRKKEARLGERGESVVEDMTMTPVASDGGPMVFSFATPSCVSLELARRCRPWVTSIVHADDFVPRLSTVSLELLKEDMRGGWVCRIIGVLLWKYLVGKEERNSNPHEPSCCHVLLRLVEIG